MVESFTLGAEERALLARYGLDLQCLRDCSLRKYGYGETVISESAASEYLYLVVSGKAKVGITAASGKNLILCFYISEGLMGEMELFSQLTEGGATVSAVSELCCIAIPLAGNRTYLEGNPDFLRFAAGELAKKLLQSSHNAVENTLCTAEIRLCHYIASAMEGGFFRDVMTDVACSIGVSYRHLYRLLDGLCQKGVLTKEQTGYLVRDAEKLKACCAQCGFEEPEAKR